MTPITHGHSWLDQKMEPDMESQQVMGPYFAEVLQAQKSGNWEQSRMQNWLSFRHISKNGGKV